MSKTTLGMEPVGEEIVLPAQFWTSVQKEAASAPERRLMLAVLESALMALGRFGRKESTPSRRRAAEVREVERWIASDARSHPFAFAAICDALGFEPHYLRRLIRGWRNSLTVDPRYRRVNAGRGRHSMEVQATRS